MSGAVDGMSGASMILPAFSCQRNLHYMSTGDEAHSASSAADRLRGWFTSRMPGDWFIGLPEIGLDREEISVVGVLPVPEAPEGMTDAERAAAAEVRSRRFREQTRQQRVEIAREAEHRFGRKVSWGVVCNDKKVMFTTFSVPVMTRLRQPERLVLDTLVDAGVARSRSDALAWCVRLVGEHEDTWLADLRDALRHVEQVRSEGPRST
jgi:hypothetical protein